MKWVRKSAPTHGDGPIEVVYLRPEARLRDQSFFQFLDYESMEDATLGLNDESFVPTLGGGLIRAADVVELRVGYWHAFESKRDFVTAGGVA